MNCSYCAHAAVKNDKKHFKDGTSLQTYCCKFCGKQFNEHTAMPMAGLEPKNSRVELLSKYQDEIEILREQVESLKQQLYDQVQLTQEYIHELKLTEHELMLMQRELCNLLMSSVRLKLDEAKELAQTILKSKKSASESLAELLSAIYDSTVKPEELEQIHRSSITTTPLRSAQTNRLVAQNNEIKARNNEIKTQNKEIKAQYKQLGVRFVGFKANFVRVKAKYDEWKADSRERNNVPTNHLQSNCLSDSPCGQFPQQPK